MILVTYEQFMNLHNFPVPPKEYNILMRAIPVGLTQLIKSHLKLRKGNSIYPALRLGGIDILDRKCNNKHISDKEKDYSKKESLQMWPITSSSRYYVLLWKSKATTCWICC